MILYNNFSSDSRVLREAKSLAKAGFDITILAINDKNLPEFEIKNNIKIKRVLKMYGPFIRPHLLRKRRSWLIEAAKLVQHEVADVYHSHDFNTLFLGWYAASKNKARLIYDSHEYLLGIKKMTKFKNLFDRIFYPLFLFGWKLHEKFLIKKADVVITVNRVIAQALVKKYKIKKPYVIMNCEDIKPIKTSNILRKKFNISQNKKIILYQGGFAKGRGLFNLIKAMEFLPDNFILVILGNGDIKEELKKLTKELKLNKKIIFVPAVSMEELPSYTTSADLGVLPYEKVSLNNYYCLPNKIFEYMSAGLPVVASNFPELKKIIQQEKIGYVFDETNPQDIADKIRLIFADRNSYLQMKENTLKTVENKYNWQKEAQKLIKIYEEVLK